MHEQFLLVIVQKSHFVVRLVVLPEEVLVGFRKSKVVPVLFVYVYCLFLSFFGFGNVLIRKSTKNAEK